MKSASFEQIQSHYDFVYSDVMERLDRYLVSLLSQHSTDHSALHSHSFITHASLKRLCAECDSLYSVSGNRSPLVLDLGCGNGALGRYLSKNTCADIIGLDFSKNAIARAKHEACEQGLFVQGDMKRLPFKSATFDAIIAWESLHLLDDPAPVLSECFALLGRNGRLIGSTYRFSTSDGAERSLDSWKADLLASGFAIRSWADLTVQWRRAMTVKHQRRWNARDSLVKQFGALGAATSDVSRRMLGIGSRPGFIESNERWEFIAEVK